MDLRDETLRIKHDTIYLESTYSPTRGYIIKSVKIGSRLREVYKTISGFPKLGQSVESLLILRLLRECRIDNCWLNKCRHKDAGLP